jgi:hypothetical protein
MDSRRKPGPQWRCEKSRGGERFGNGNSAQRGMTRGFAWCSTASRYSRKLRFSLISSGFLTSPAASPPRWIQVLSAYYSFIFVYIYTLLYKKCNECILIDNNNRNENEVDPATVACYFYRIQNPFSSGFRGKVPSNRRLFTVLGILNILLRIISAKAW